MICVFKKVVLGTSYRFRETAGYIYIILDVYDKCMFIEMLFSIELQNTDLCR